MNALREGLRDRVCAVLDRFHAERSLAGAVLTWAALSAGSAGFATGPLLWYGGRRLRSLAVRLCALGYLTLTIVVLAASRTGTPGPAVLATVWALLWLVGGAQAADVGRRVWYACRTTPDALSERPAPAVPSPESAVEWERWRASRREDARQIAAADPGRASELRIGRPDLPRRYEDGGLVDVNHVPVGVLRNQLGLAGEVARRVVDERTLRRGFGGVEELVMFCELRPDVLATIRDRLYFGPRG